ncbi:Flp pilus assembly complex ATPase component TadA [Paenibacillus alvei]|uniref:Flp pilus assembly complex ATPase component TadA n=1 Tax=Paenibacillus alvei TaxID=44250 RepID=A0ABT4H7G0_PAEAL|nr:ATPase, T2SS/T4P/T4SS family [Paenibacillus alvei]MCY9542851.1 Flp pilus assembly complex ATPase component TadA [Paenibacillus alvei]MCY9736094.1 Flp pilus assembly complex ATPase component TadA [Paenibacillus alvei]MCY9757361.1 Flp pilus assembly complex ATPase component TadA [Paenibacillus alvei]MCY9764900.1 Flp pilus assembly complex ATPase component TadA [Paenibacillus alvei]MCY9771002.1 Flp pilus assembly complex ATPase component TadA [Paenibacillus alvei]
MTKTISIANLGGGNSTEFVLDMMKNLPKGSRSLWVELPCLGIPRLSYALDQVRLEKEKTVDSLLIDYDRQERKSLDDYIVKTDYGDCMLINPRARPEIPTPRMLETNKTLIDMPVYIRLQMQGKYDYIFFVLQGMMYHPMTHFSLRSSDVCILHTAVSYEFVGNYTNYKNLYERFGISKDRMCLYVEDINITQNFKEEKVFSKISEISKQIGLVEPIDIQFETKIDSKKLNDESVGTINPIEFLNYKYQELEMSTEISNDDEQNRNKLIADVRNYLYEQHLDEFVDSTMNQDTRQKIKYYIADYIRERNTYKFSVNINEIITYIQREITDMGVIQEILDNPNISSIEINGPDQVIVEEKGEIDHKKEIRFQDVKHIYQIIDRMLLPIGKPISSTEPIVDANIRGFRINVIAGRSHGYQGLSARSPLISIRKFPPRVYTDEECIKYGNLSQEMADFIKFIVPNRANILVSGSVNSGKTTQLLRFPLSLDYRTRIFTIEDSEELMFWAKEQYAHYVNLPSLLVKEIEDIAKSYGMDKLIKATLRQNAIYIAIGEIRDEAVAKEFLKALNIGYIAWSTIHSNSYKDAVIRLLQLVGNDPTAASQIATSLDFVIYQKRLISGVRVVTDICEVVGMNGTDPIMNPIFKYDYRTKVFNRVGSIKSEKMIEKLYQLEVPQDQIEKWCDLSALSA